MLFLYLIAHLPRGSWTRLLPSPIRDAPAVGSEDCRCDEVTARRDRGREIVNDALEPLVMQTCLRFQPQRERPWARPGRVERSFWCHLERVRRLVPCRTMSHSWSASVSLNGWRRVPGSTRIASSGPTD